MTHELGEVIFDERNSPFTSCSQPLGAGMEKILLDNMETHITVAYHICMNANYKDPVRND